MMCHISIGSAKMGGFWGIRYVRDSSAVSREKAVVAGSQVASTSTSRTGRQYYGSLLSLATNAKLSVANGGMSSIRYALVAD
jgi:hypothetical protein